MKPEVDKDDLNMADKDLDNLEDRADRKDYLQYVSDLETFDFYSLK